MRVSNETTTDDEEARVRKYREEVARNNDYLEKVSSVADRFFTSPSDDPKIDADKKELKKLLDIIAEYGDKFRDARAVAKLSGPRELDKRNEVIWSLLDKRAQARRKVDEILDSYRRRDGANPASTSASPQRDLLLLNATAFAHKEFSDDQPRGVHDIYTFEQSAQKNSPDSFQYACDFNRAWGAVIQYDGRQKGAEEFKELPFKGFADMLKDEENRAVVFSNARFVDMEEKVIPRGNNFGSQWSDARHKTVLDAISRSESLTRLAYNYIVAKESVRYEYESAGIWSRYKLASVHKEAVKRLASIKSKETRALKQLENALRKELQGVEVPAPDDEDGA